MGQSILAQLDTIRHGACARMMRQLQKAWAVGGTQHKRVETSNLKKISKRYLPNVGMGR